MLLTAALENSKVNLEHESLIALENFNAPAMDIVIQNQNVFSLHALGRPLGIVVGSGNSAVYTVNIGEGRTLLQAIVCLDFMIRALTVHMMTTLTDSGHLSTVTEWCEIVHDMKKQLRYIGRAFVSETKAVMELLDKEKTYVPVEGNVMSVMIAGNAALRRSSSRVSLIRRPVASTWRAHDDGVHGADFLLMKIKVVTLLVRIPCGTTAPKFRCWIEMLSPTVHP
mmetsp:Transcript_73313/g.238590  ORF Transcript_73313/g.238590 Transcript_73313/m.238590 type:complete len:225 (+) Transcript_73313:249-923(+)